MKRSECKEIEIKELSSKRQYWEGKNGDRKQGRATQPQEDLVTPSHIKLHVKKDENTVGEKNGYILLSSPLKKTGGEGVAI